MGRSNTTNKRFTRIDINLSYLSNNISVIKSCLKNPATGIMAVVKSNAYGHGLVEVSKHIVKNRIKALGVALAEDGIRLRKAGIKLPVYILGEPPMEIVEDAIKYDFILCLNSFEKAMAISNKCEKYGKKVNVNLKVDTGMNRVGINYRHAVDEIARIKELRGLKADGIFTHFSCAGEKSEDYTKMQFKRFNDVLKSLENKNIRFKTVHCANSAAFLRNKEYHFDMVRLGILLYGLSPFGADYRDWLESDAVDVLGRLKPILSLKSKVSFVKEVASGESISYGATFKTNRQSIIATVPIGYADGYSRLFSNKASVLINGQAALVAGNVTMDQLMVDVTDIARKSIVAEGTEVTLIGNSSNKIISADHLASIIGTINYEILCMLKDRIPRIYIQ
ncbi:MAG: alanine racemase [Actinobacteria bacterium]|nr:alanine racemase [Actinomycetota bacterium]